MRKSEKRKQETKIKKEEEGQEERKKISTKRREREERQVTGVGRQATEARTRPGSRFR